MRYGVRGVRIIRFERKRQMILKLSVLLKSTESQETLAEETPLLQL